MILLAGCAGSDLATDRPEPLRVAAASDLRQVLPTLIEAFGKQNSLAIEPTFGASGQLAQQIRQGAPFDLFLAANQKYVDNIAAADLIRKDSVRDYARGALVLAVHEASGGAIQSITDLTRPEIKHIALANPDLAPYGAAGKQVLQRSGVWNAVAPKLAPSETVLQALQFVRQGNAEAGLVGKAIAHVPGVRLIEVDGSLYDPIVQRLGIVAASKRAADAEAFARFFLSDEGQKILRAAGFAAPSGAVNP